MLGFRMRHRHSDSTLEPSALVLAGGIYMNIVLSIERCYHHGDMKG